MARKSNKIKLTLSCGRVGEDPRTGTPFAQIPGKDYLFEPAEALALVDAHQGEPADDAAADALEAYRDSLAPAAGDGESADGEAAESAETPAAAAGGDAPPATPKRTRAPRKR